MLFLVSISRMLAAPVAKFPFVDFFSAAVLRNTICMFTPRALIHVCSAVYAHRMCACVHKCHCRWRGKISTMFWPLTVHPSALIASALPETLLLLRQQYRGPARITVAFDSWRRTHTHAGTHTHWTIHILSFHKACGISPQEKLPDSLLGAQKQPSKNRLIFFPCMLTKHWKGCG